MALLFLKAFCGDDRREFIQCFPKRAKAISPRIMGTTLVAWQTSVATTKTQYRSNLSYVSYVSYALQFNA